MPYRFKEFMLQVGLTVPEVAKQCICFMDGKTLPLSDAAHVSLLPQAFTTSCYPLDKPIAYECLCNHEQVWVEPIGTPPIIQKNLRGWYHVYDLFVKNEFGQHFFFHSYGNQWLAFKKCSPDE